MYKKRSFLQFALAETVPPSTSRNENKPLERLPLMKHSIPCHLTTSNSLKPFTFHGAWFLFNRPPLRIFALCNCLLCLRTWRITQHSPMGSAANRLLIIRASSVWLFPAPYRMRWHFVMYPYVRVTFGYVSRSSSSKRSFIAFIAAASRSDRPRLLPSTISPRCSALWHVSHNVTRLFGASPPVLRDSMWWTLSTLSLLLPWQCWHVCPSLARTYSRTFQKPICSPCWYSVPSMSGLFIRCASKSPTSTCVSDTGSMLFTFATARLCASTLLRTDGGSHPRFLDALRLRKRTLR